MTPFGNGKQALAEGLSETDPTVSSPDISAPSPLVSARYYFNLTNGDAMIRDEEGIQSPGSRDFGHGSRRGASRTGSLERG